MFPQQSVVIDLFKISPAVKLKFNFRHCNCVHRKKPSSLRFYLPPTSICTSFLVQGSNDCYMLIYRQHRIISVLLYHSSSNSTFTTLSVSFITASDNFVIQTVVAFKHLLQIAKKCFVLEILHTTRYCKGQGEILKKPTKP